MLFAVFKKKCFPQQLNSKNDDPVLSFKSIFRLETDVSCRLLDEHGLRLEKVWPTFSTFGCYTYKIAKKYLLLAVRVEICLISSSKL